MQCDVISQVALAARPGSAWFLSAEERMWLQTRQDRELALRQAELASSGKAWGEHRLRQYD